MQRLLNPYPELGENASLNGFRPFRSSDPWNTRVDNLPVDPNSNLILRAVLARNPGARLFNDFGTFWNGAPSGIPYVVVGRETEPVRISFTDYPRESDPGPYPVPENAPIEGGNRPENQGDRHVLVVDRDRAKLFELYRAFPDGSGGWLAGCGAVYDLWNNTVRPAGHTSADAAGLPIFPGLARYDEVANGVIAHALRFTLKRTRRAYVAPARHFASRYRDANLPPMGMRVRLKSNISLTWLAPQSRVIALALKRYGMILADNGSDFFVSGAPHPQWDADQLRQLKRFKPGDFEVVKMGPMTLG